MRSNLLRAALCSEDSNTPDIVTAMSELPPELQEDTEVAELAQGLTDVDLQAEEASAALESLFDVQLLVQSLRSDDVNSQRTNQALAAIYAPVLNGTAAGQAAMESLSEVTSNAVALEGKIIDAIRNSFDNWFQAIVVGNKHQNDIVMDFFKSTNGKVLKYSKALAETEEEFRDKRHKFREGDHHASLIELWYFFSNQHGHSKNIIADLHADTSASKHILTEYPRKVLDTLHHLNSVISSAKLMDDKGAVNFFAAVERLPAIESLFSREYLGEGILFNVTSMVYRAASPGRIVEIAGKRFPGLAELAARAQVEQKKSLGHSAWKVISQTGPGSIVSNYQREDFKLTTDEIGQVIEAGQNYLQNIEGYMSLKQKIESTFREAESALGKLQRAVGYNSEMLGYGLKQVLSYMTNLSKAINTPAADEVVRSLKGAKYCNYLALRMIYNASKYF